MQFTVVRGYRGSHAVDEFVYLRTSKCFFRIRSEENITLACHFSTIIIFRHRPIRKQFNCHLQAGEGARSRKPQRTGAFAGEATANWQETNAIDIGANKQDFVPNLLCLKLIKCNQRNW